LSKLRVVAPRSTSSTNQSSDMRRASATGRGGARDTTKSRIITAAERLFAKDGIDAVSIRDITKAANANSAAIHYHFGSKHNLVLSVLEHRVAQLRDRRVELMTEVEQLDPPTARAVAGALVRPSAELAHSRRGGQHYVTFVTALSNHAKYAPMVNEVFEPLALRFLAVLGRVTPEVPEPVRALRFAVATEVVNRVFSNLGALERWMEAHAPGADVDITDELVDFIAAGLEAPAGR
jgi:AcrR family transcriptional regulator